MDSEAIGWLCLTSLCAAGSMANARRAKERAQRAYISRERAWVAYMLRGLEHRRSKKREVSNAP